MVWKKCSQSWQYDRAIALGFVVCSLLKIHSELSRPFCCVMCYKHEQESVLQGQSTWDACAPKNKSI